MKPFNRVEYNKLCVEFTGTSKEYLIPQGYAYQYLNYDRDWNLIMKVVDKIDLLQNGVWIQSWYDNRYTVDIWGDSEELPVVKVENTDRMHAVVEAIWQFLNWYYDDNK